MVHIDSLEVQWNEIKGFPLALHFITNELIRMNPVICNSIEITFSTIKCMLWWISHSTAPHDNNIFSFGRSESFCHLHLDRPSSIQKGFKGMRDVLLCHLWCYQSWGNLDMLNFRLFITVKLQALWECGLTVTKPE